MPKTAEPWSLTSLREKLIKIGAKVVSHGRYGLTPVSWRDESLGSGSLAYVMLSSGFVAFFGSAPGGAILPSRPAH